MAHRIASYKSPQGSGYNVSLKEIYMEWSLDDVLDAHEILDLYDMAYEKAMKDAEKKK